MSTDDETLPLQRAAPGRAGYAPTFDKDMAGVKRDRRVAAGERPVREGRPVREAAKLFKRHHVTPCGAATAAGSAAG